MQDTTKVIEKIKMMLPHLNEAQKKVYVASEALSLGRGGKAILERELGVSHNTINKGIVVLNQPIGLRYKTLGISEPLHYQCEMNFDTRTEAQIPT